jgi:hypothetical protein
MTPQRYERIKEVFLAVCDRPTDEQDALATELTNGDSKLRDEVQALLTEHRKGGDANSTERLSGQLPARGRTPAAENPQHRSTGSADSIPRSRFAPGTILAERYRIVALIGSGGMGNVYRADDLALDQPVALKFLPEGHGKDPVWLEWLRNEVRLTRQVAHPNVCRVFDLGNVDGEAFITMEYVDGENLASLLRRIGRVSATKALQISRQLCAALSAAHRCSVLHRDLKLANVMLDGEGQVRVTDFGIAATIDEAGHGALTGTPAYMAPELFSGRKATIRSDLYSLGVVLYEVFTGQPLFEANTPLEYKRLHETVMPALPSKWEPNIDPLVERVILKCLEKDPQSRPGSAVAVAASLPGGDALAAALAAGETPSPQVVAAAGGNAGLSHLVATCCLAATIVGLVAIMLLSRYAFFLPQAHLEKPPDVLVERAQAIVHLAGANNSHVDQAYDFWFDDNFANFIERYQPKNRQWARLGNVRPGAVYFWYCQSPEYLVSKDYLGIVTPDDLGRLPVGSKQVWLDVLGRLKRLEFVPDPTDSPAPGHGAAAVVNFAPLFDAAGLDISKFTSVAPALRPPAYADTRYAWEGVYPEEPQVHVRIEAASLAGTPIFFRIVEPWESLTPEPEDDSPSGGATYVTFQAMLLVALVAGAILLVSWNLRDARGDRRGARRVALFFGILEIVIWLLLAHHVPQLQQELELLSRMLGSVLVHAGLVWMIYLALEPYVRRIWPETIISWSRILAGRIADPLVGAHVLIGMLIGVVYMLVDQFKNMVPEWIKRAPALPRVDVKVRMLAFNSPSSTLLLTMTQAMAASLLCLLLLVLLRLMLRGKWLAGAAFILVAAAVSVRWRAADPLNWCFELSMAALLMLALVRFGLVTAIAAVFTAWSVWNQPITSNLGIWYAQSTLIEFVMVIALSTAAWRLTTKS